MSDLPAASGGSDAPDNKGECKWCQVIFTRPPSAPHKEFCSEEHRNKFHAKERQDALARLRAERIKEAQDELISTPQTKTE